MSGEKSLKDYLELFKENFSHIDEIYDEQERMALRMLSALKNEGSVIVCQGPTGMGKSLVIDAVVMKLANEGKRALISSPVYSALNDNHHLPLQEVEIDHAILHGFSWWKKQGFKCPKDNFSYPSKLLCIKGKCEEASCPIYQEYQEIRVKNIVLTVHHKIASTPAIIKEEKFDIVIVDESHNLPQIIEGLAFKRLTTKELIDTINQMGGASPRVQKILDRAKNRSQVKDADRRKVLREVRKLSTQTQDMDELFFHAQAVRVDFINNNWVFYCPQRRVAKLPPNISVALVSATIENPPDHIKDCRFDSLSQAPAFQLHLTDRFRRRFRKRPVYYLYDGPILRKDRDSLEIYEDFRQKANALIHNLVLVVRDQVTMILCRADADARSIQAFLESDSKLKNQLIYLGDEDQRDTDEIEGFLRKEIDQGKRLIISTAKNGLWEGANIPELRCVVIDSLPYRAPNPFEEPLRSKGGFYRSSMFRFMLRRLQQGIGRLVRQDDEWGIAIIVDGRMYTGKRWIHKQLPSWIVNPDILYLEKSTTIVKKVHRMKEQLIAGKPGSKIIGLDEFGVNGN